MTASLFGMGAMAEETKTFTVGFDAEYPPYGYMGDDGEYTGFDLELAQAVCDLEGWELVKTPINWDSKDMELDSGSIDCIWNGFTMTGREDDYTWSKPVSYTHLDVYKRQVQWTAGKETATASGCRSLHKKTKNRRMLMNKTKSVNRLYLALVLWVFLAGRFLNLLNLPLNLSLIHI